MEIDLTLQYFNIQKEYIKNNDVAFSQENVQSGNNLQYNTTSNSTNSSAILTEMSEVIMVEEQETEQTQNANETSNSSSTALEVQTSQNVSLVQKETSAKERMLRGSAAFLEEKVFELPQSIAEEFSKEGSYTFDEITNVVPKILVRESQATPNVSQFVNSSNEVNQIVYEGNAQSYIDNDNYEVVSQSIVMIDSNTEQVTIVVEAKMKTLKSLPSVVFMMLMASFILLAIKFKNWVYKFFQEDLLGGLNSILRYKYYLIQFLMIIIL